MLLSSLGRRQSKEVSTVNKVNEVAPEVSAVNKLNEESTEIKEEMIEGKPLEVM